MMIEDQDARCAITRKRPKRYAGGVKSFEAVTEDEATLPDYDESGVDLSLIRWMLSLTPAERLRVSEEFVNSILTVRELNATK